MVDRFYGVGVRMVGGVGFGHCGDEGGDCGVFVAV